MINLFLLFIYKTAFFGSFVVLHAHFLSRVTYKKKKEKREK